MSSNNRAGSSTVCAGWFGVEHLPDEAVKVAIRMKIDGASMTQEGTSL